MADPAKVNDQNILPVQALFNLDNSFNTFIGQGQPFYATVNPQQSGLQITNSTIDSTTIGANTPSTGVFTNIQTTTGQISTAPSNNIDIVNKAYVDAIAQGLNPKAAVKCATTANITLSGLQTIDTYSVQVGDRVLVKNQTNAPDNGIYVAASGAWVRSTDMDIWAEVPGAYTVALYGSVNANTSWVSTSADTGTINVTPITFVQFSGVNTYYAGTGLTLASNTFSITNTGVTASTYGSASSVPVLAINAQGQVTSATPTLIAIAASQITSGTIASSLISGSYTGITGVGTLTVGTWNANTIGVAYGGTGATSLTGYVKGTGTNSLTGVTSIPNTDISGLGTMSTQNANSVAITGGSAAVSTLKTLGLTGYLYGNDTGAVTASTTIPTSAISGNFVSTFSAGTTGLTPNTNTAGVVTLGGTLNVANGGTGVTSSSGANSVVLRDANGNIFTNCLFEGYLSQAASGTTIVLTASSAQNFVITGSGGQTIKLPNATTLPAGAIFTFNNNQTSGSIIVQNNSSTTVATINSGGYVAVVLTDNSIAAGSWDRHDQTPSNTSWSTNTLDYPGSITSATWNGNTIAISKGGTNGTATPTAGAIAYGTGTAYAFTAAGSTGQVLTSNGSGVPTWSSAGTSITLSDDTTTNATRYPLFAAATSGTVSTEYTSSTKYQYNPSTGVLTATGFSGSGASLTSLTAGNLTGTIPSGVLGNSTVYIGTTAIALNRASASQTLTGTSIDGNAGTATTATTATNATNVAITDDTSTNANFYPTFVSTSSSNQAVETSSTKLKYNPSTGTLTSTIVQSGTQANYIQSTGAATTFEPTITAAGSDTNVALAIKTQGTGAIDLAAGSSGVNISNGGTVTAITRTAQGNGYTSAPAITVSAPTTAGGVQATVTGYIWINSVTLASGGTGYSVNDVLTVSGGSYVTNPLKITVTGVSGGVITTFTFVSFDLYNTAPSNPVSVTGGTGSGATFTLNFTNSSTYTITNAGSGYVEQPTVSFSGGGSSGAAAYATVGSLPKITGLASLDVYTQGGQSFRFLDGGVTPANYLQVRSAGTGGSARMDSVGNDTNVGMFLSTKGTGSFSFATNTSSTQFQIAHTASAVNYVQVTGGATATRPSFAATGSDTNVGISYISKGAGQHVFSNGGQYAQLRVNGAVNAVNYLQVDGSLANAAPILSSQGSDGNIDLTLTPKGTGVVRAQGTALSAENGIVLNKQTVAASATIASGYSAHSAGPITVASGQSVTIASGSRWVIL